MHDDSDMSHELFSKSSFSKFDQRWIQIYTRRCQAVTNIAPALTQHFVLETSQKCRREHEGPSFTPISPCEVTLLSSSYQPVSYNTYFIL